MKKVILSRLCHRDLDLGTDRELNLGNSESQPRNSTQELNQRNSLKDKRSVVGKDPLRDHEEHPLNINRKRTKRQDILPIHQRMYTKIADEERQYYGHMGLKMIHIDLLNRLVLFSNQKTFFQVTNDYLKDYLIIKSRTTIWRYLDLLCHKNLIHKILTHHHDSEGHIKTKRYFKINQSLLYQQNSSHSDSSSDHMNSSSFQTSGPHKESAPHRCSFSNPLNYLSQNLSREIHHQKQEIQKSLSSPPSYRNIDKLTDIFQIKSQELGYDRIERDHLKYEASKFHHHYQMRGFQRWIKYGKRMTYRAVEHWILYDKWGIFHEYRNIMIMKSKEKEHQRVKEALKKEKMEQEAILKSCSHLSDYFGLIAIENYRNNSPLSKEDLIEQLKKEFADDEYLEIYLNLSKEKVV